MNDLQDGEGICTYADGAVYTGTWSTGMRSGEGELRLGDYDEEFLARSVYRGGWKMDKYSGLGSLLASNGDRYDGVWVNGQRQGRGTQRYVKAGERYQGIWMRDMRHGRGKHHYSDGTVYDGQWRNDMRDGKGKCQYVDMARIGVSGTYNGMWKRNLKDGRGSFDFENGDKFEGMWKGDVRCGRGKCVYHTGEVYDGDWDKDVRKGQGGETMPREKEGDDWGTLTATGLLMSLRINPEIARPRAPGLEGTDAVKPQDPSEPSIAKQSESELPKLVGKIVDPKGAGVGGVAMCVQPTINSLDKVIDVDDEGAFTLAGMPEGGIKLSLSLKKEGYASLQTSSSLMSKRKFENSMKILLAPLTMTEVFDSTAGVTMADPRKNTVVIPENALCYTDGTQYEGKAEVSALAIDSSAEHSLARVPGFEGVNIDSRRCLVSSFGAMYVHMRAVPSGEELELRGGQFMTLEFSSKVSRESKSPSAWSFDAQGGYWSQTDSDVFADDCAVAAPQPGEGFASAPAYEEGAPDRSNIVDWTVDVSETLGQGPVKVTRLVETPAPEAPEPAEGEAEGEAEAEAEAEPEAEPEAESPAPSHQEEESLEWQGTRFQAPGEVGARVYMYKPEQSALEQADGDVSAAAQALTKQGGSTRAAEVRLVQHLVLQDESCAHATLAVPEIIEAIEEHGDAGDAAKRLCVNPIVQTRSRQEALMEQAAEAVPFAPVSGSRVLEALNDAKDDPDVALQAIVDSATHESEFEQLYSILWTLGLWKSSTDVAAALEAHEFSVLDAAATMSGISGMSSTTWGKGQTNLEETYKRAKVQSILADTLKYCDLDERSVEAALNINDGDVAPAADGLVREWRGQQLILELKAQLMAAPATAWVDIPAAQVKAALMENGSRDAGLAFLTEQWEPRRALYDDVFSALEATAMMCSDAEICAALQESEFEAEAALSLLQAPSGALASGKLLRVMEGLMERYDFLPVAEDVMAAKIEESDGDVAAALEALAEEIGDKSVDDSDTWWMASYKAKRRSSGEGTVDPAWTTRMQVAHTGWWNCAAAVPAGLVTGRLVDGQSTRAGAYVRPVGDQYHGWSPVGRVDENGVFAVVGPWEASVKLNVRDTDADLDGISRTLRTNYDGGVTDLGDIELSSIARPEVAAAPRFGGKRKVKDDVQKAREAQLAKSRELTRCVRDALSSVGVWASDTAIGGELARRGWAVDRAAVALTNDNDILAKQLRNDIRRELQAEFGTVPLTDAGIQSAIDHSDGSGEVAVAALRSGIVRVSEEQERKTRTIQLRESVRQACELIGPVLRDGNEALFAKGMTLEETAALREEHLSKGRELSALRCAEYALFRQLQECSNVLASEWSTPEAVHSGLLRAGVRGIVTLYQQQAVVYCASARYDVATALLRKADFITSQPSLMPGGWEERMKLRAVTLNNRGAMSRRREDNDSALASFEAAAALWQAAGLASPPSYPLYLATEHPISLYLNTAIVLIAKGDATQAMSQADAAIGAMLGKAGAPSIRLEGLAREAEKDAQAAVAELEEWESEHDEEDSVSSKVEEEHCDLEKEAVKTTEKMLQRLKDARERCWRNYDDMGEASQDFTRMLASAHYIYAVAAAAAAEVAAAAAAEEEAAAEEASAASDAGSEKPKRVAAEIPSPPSEAELAELHQSRAVALATAALGESHPETVKMAAELGSEQLAGCIMYLQL